MLNNRLSYLIAILLFLFSQCVYSAPKCNIEKFNQYQIEYCLYEGRGPLLVLEGSQGNSMSVWPKSFLNQLNQFSTILTYNRIGYGQSYYYQHKKLNSVTARSVSVHLEALLNRLKINKPTIIIAHSIGGIYAQYFIRNYPRNVVGLVMIDADSSFEPKFNSPFNSKNPEKKGSIGYLEASGFNQSMDQVNSSPHFPSIPLLIITATNHGSDKNTEMLWQKLQKNLVNQSPQGVQIIAYNSGHFIFQDNPALVIDAIHRFIRNNKLSNAWAHE